MQDQTLGIDLAKHSFVISSPRDGKLKPTQITYDDPLWWKKLIAHVAPAAIICAEPTGWHLLSAVAGIIDSHRPDAEIWLVPHRTSAAIRETHVASAKTDALDAQALALVSQWIFNGQPPRNVRRFEPSKAAAAMNLRLAVNQHRRLTKTSTRLQNQIEALAHGIWPAFASGRATYIKAVLAGLISPDDIAAALLDPPPAFADGRARRWLKKLIAGAPQIHVHDGARAALTMLALQLQNLDADREVLEQAMIQQINADPFLEVTQRWSQIPAVGPLWLAALHVASDAVADQVSADDFRAMMGHAPITRQSGTNEKLDGNTPRKGYRPALDALNMWTLLLLHPDQRPNAVADYFDTHKHVYKPFNAARRKFAGILSGIARDASGRPPLAFPVVQS